MDEPDLVRESLRDITSLLLLLHEKYLRDSDSESTLLALMSFLDDIGLGMSVSIVEAEKFRQMVIKGKRSSILSQEDFYEWLRHIGDFVYGDGKDRRKALHKLLTQNIVPLARNEHVVAHKTLNWSKTPAHSKYLMKYFDFVLLWYCSLTAINRDMHTRWTPIFGYWEASKAHHGSITVSHVIQSLVSAGLSSSLFDGPDFKEFLWSHFHSASSASNSRAVTLQSFLAILAFVCQRLPLSEVQVLGLGDSAETRVRMLMATVAGKMLKSILQEFLDFDQEESMKLSGDGRVQASSSNSTSTSTFRGISVDSLLWMSRQAGLTQLEGIDIPWIIDEICTYETQSAASGTRYIPLPQVQSLLCRLLEHSTQLPCSKEMSLTGVDELGRTALYISRACPAMLFASPLRIPSPLANLYTMVNVSRLRSTDLNHKVSSVYWACASIAQQLFLHFSSPPSPDPTSPDVAVSVPVAATAEAFWGLCEDKNIVPTVVPMSLVKSTCVYVLGSAEPEQHVCLGDFIEMIFVLAQMCFEDISVMERQSGELIVLPGGFNPALHPAEEDPVVFVPPEQQTVLKMVLLLECLIAVNADEVPRLQPQASPTVTDSQTQPLVAIDEEKENLMSTSPSHRKADQRDSPHEDDSHSLRYLRDVLILLMHFPHNSFSLNPWEVFQILLSKSSPRLRANVHPTTIVDADSSECLSGVFEEFCRLYFIPTESLSHFFASFYTEPSSSSAVELVMKAKVQNALLEPSLLLLMQDDVLRLCYANVDLLRWEYCRYAMRCRSADPFTAGVDTPMPTSEFMANRPQDTLVTGGAAILWATHAKEYLQSQLHAGGSTVDSFPNFREDAVRILHDVLLLSAADENQLGPSTNEYLTFSMFVIYMVRTWTSPLLASKPNTAEELLRDKTTQQNYFLSVKSMLSFISISLVKVQKLLRTRLLFPLVGLDSGKLFRYGGDRQLMTAASDADISDNIIDVSHALTYLLGMYNERHPPVEHSIVCSYLPPRPPSRLWDAPRLVEFLKMCGVLQFFETSVSAWLGFGDYYHKSPEARQLSGGETIDTTGYLSQVRGVPPFPLRIQSSVIHEVILSACGEISSASSASAVSFMNGMSIPEFLFLQIILPLAVGVIDRSDEVSAADKASVQGQNSSKSLEDILRYGGDRLMYALAECSPFINTVYNQLCTSNAEGPDDDLSLPVACRYLSCNGVLRAGLVAVQAKRSLHPRLRALPRPTSRLPSSVSAATAEVTVSRMEFEELFVRCALSAWEASGASRLSDRGMAVDQLDFHSFIAASSGRPVVDDAGGSTITANHSVLTSAIIDQNTGFLLLPGREDDEQTGVSKTQKTAERYIKELLTHCISSETLQASSRVVSAWGVDFLSPFVATMRDVIGMPPLSKRPATTTVNLLGSETHADADPLSYPQWPSLGKHYRPSLDSQNTMAPQSTGFQTSSENDRIHVFFDSCESSADQTNDIVLGEIYGHQIMEPTVPYIDPARAHPTYFSPLKKDLMDMQPGSPATSAGTTSRHGTSPLQISSLPRQARQLNSAPAPQPSSPGQLRTPAVASVGRASPSNSPRRRSDGGAGSWTSNADVVPISTLLDGTKEALWPIYATYCSCGDSDEPGKLSGPNLFSLLSKLGILTDDTLLSDIGVLIHQISAYAHAQNPLDAASLYVEDIFESPSLTFEEFIVFLCAFSQLRFDGVVAAVPLPQVDEKLPGKIPLSGHTIRSTAPADKPTGSVIGRGPDNLSRRERRELEYSTGGAGPQRRSAASQAWFAQWKEYMGKSSSFRTLVQEFVLPILKRHPLLAFPEDARHRDRYGSVFSLEVLLAIEGAESTLKTVFQRHKQSSASKAPPRRAATASTSAAGLAGDFEIDSIMSALRRINLVPRVITEQQVLQLVRDVLPAADSRPAGNSRSVSRGSIITAETPGTAGSRQRVLFPQWEWVLCVVAFEAVDIAVHESPTYTPPEKIPSLVADIVSSIARAMKAV